MRVALVTGSFPPDPCGVGAYVERLTRGLVASDVDAQVVHGTDRDARGARSVSAESTCCNLPDLVHAEIQRSGMAPGSDHTR